MARQPAEDSLPVSVDEGSVRLILTTLREAGPEGALKSALRGTLEKAAMEADHARLPKTEAERQRWAKALDKKVERCLRSLTDDGAKIERIQAPAGRLACFVLKRGPKWDEHVTGEARLALKLATLTLSHSGTDLWQEKLELIEELASRHMSNRDRILFDQLEKAVKVYGGVEDPILTGEDILENLLKALHAKRMVEVEYQRAGDTQARSLRLAPHALTHDIFSGGAYLLAWDPKASAPKQYRLNRMSSVKILREPSVITHPEKMQRALDYQIGAWTCGDPPFEVVVRIKGAGWISSLQEAPPSLRDFESTLDKGGKSLMIRFKANNAEGPIRWLLQFGSCAEVLEPKALRDRVIDELKQALQAY